MKNVQTKTEPRTKNFLRYVVDVKTSQRYMVCGLIYEMGTKGDTGSVVGILPLKET